MTDREISDRTGVIAPPVRIFLGFLILGLVIDFMWPAWVLGIRLRVVAGLVFIPAGGALAAWSFATLRAHGTTGNPGGGVSAMVRDGPFQFTRNPIYVAMILLYLGAALTLGGLATLLTLVPVFVIMHVGVVLREEAYLERKFGADYADYKAAVRRWV